MVNKKLLPSDLFRYKRDKQKVSMLTCYDYSFANIANDSHIDVLLVGDSGAMTIFGYPDTTFATIEMMELMTKAVSTGAPMKLVVADMPFLSHRKGINYALECAEKLIRAGANAIKIEGVDGHLDVIEHIVASGIPVMGHLGLTPQSVHAQGYKVQGKSLSLAEIIKKQAKQLQDVGCFAVVVECVPSLLAKEICNIIDIPVIGIGAGCDVDGQVLVLQDMLGMTTNLKPKFVRHFFDGFVELKNSLNQYHQEVIKMSYPNKEESYEVEVR